MNSQANFEKSVFAKTSRTNARQEGEGRGTCRPSGTNHQYRNMACNCSSGSFHRPEFKLIAVCTKVLHMAGWLPPSKLHVQSRSMPGGSKRHVLFQTRLSSAC